MGYAAVISSVYLIWFFPGFFSRPLLVLPLSALLALLLLHLSQDVLPVLVSVLLFSVIASTLSFSSPDIGIDEPLVASIRGTVIQDSQQKTGRRTGVRIMLSSAADEDGNLFSAEGSIYVIAPASDLAFGDSAVLFGTLDGDVFYAHSISRGERGLIGKMRSHVIEWIKDRLSPFSDAGEFASLLLLGTGRDGAFPLMDNARKAGLSHVIALSGMHLSILAMMISWPLERIFGQRGGKAAVFVVLFLFTFLAGFRPSLLRALLFRFLLSLGFSIEQSFTLSLAALLILAPWSAVDLGAAYSFLSLGGIFLMSRTLNRAVCSLLPLPVSLYGSIAASTAALLFSIPLTISVFGEYQLGAIITSYPFGLLIILYMWTAIITIALPPAAIVLQFLYTASEKLFLIASSLPVSDGLLPYVLLAASSLLLYAKSVLRH